MVSMDDIKVLIIEDEMMSGSLYKAFVEAMDGFTVAGTAGRRRAVFDQIAGSRPDLIICEDNLPDCCGLEILAYIRTKGIPSDFMMVTALHDGATLNAALRYGIVDYILKPFKADRLIAALASYREFARQLAAKKTLSQADLDGWYKRKTIQYANAITDKIV